MAVLGFQNQNMPATDDANEFDKFDVKKVDPTKDTGIAVDNLQQNHLKICREIDEKWLYII
jgi:hypothetical protein